MGQCFGSPYEDVDAAFALLERYWPGFLAARCHLGCGFWQREPELIHAFLEHASATKEHPAEAARLRQMLSVAFRTARWRLYAEYDIDRTHLDNGIVTGIALEAV